MFRRFTSGWNCVSISQQRPPISRPSITCEPLLHDTNECRNSHSLWSTHHEGGFGGSVYSFNVTASIKYSLVSQESQTSVFKVPGCQLSLFSDQDPPRRSHPAQTDLTSLTLTARLRADCLHLSRWENTERDNTRVSSCVGQPSYLLCRKNDVAHKENNDAHIDLNKLILNSVLSLNCVVWADTFYFENNMYPVMCADERLWTHNTKWSFSEKSIERTFFKFNRKSFYLFIFFSCTPNVCCFRSTETVTRFHKDFHWGIWNVNLKFDTKHNLTQNSCFFPLAIL